MGRSERSERDSLPPSGGAPSRLLGRRWPSPASRRTAFSPLPSTIECRGIRPAYCPHCQQRPRRPGSPRAGGPSPCPEAVARCGRRPRRTHVSFRAPTGRDTYTFRHPPLSHLTGAAAEAAAAGRSSLGERDSVPPGTSRALPPDPAAGSGLGPGGKAAACARRQAGVRGFARVGPHRRGLGCVRLRDFPGCVRPLLGASRCKLTRRYPPESPPSRLPTPVRTRPAGPVRRGGPRYPT